MAFFVEINRSAERELKTLSAEAAARIGERLRALADDPRPHQSQRLKGSPDRHLRIGAYRAGHEKRRAGRVSAGDRGGAVTLNRYEQPRLFPQLRHL